MGDTAPVKCSITLQNSRGAWEFCGGTSRLGGSSSVSGEKPRSAQGSAMADRQCRIQAAIDQGLWSPDCLPACGGTSSGERQDFGGNGIFGVWGSRNPVKTGRKGGILPQMNANERKWAFRTPRRGVPTIRSWILTEVDAMGSCRSGIMALW